MNHIPSMGSVMTSFPHFVAIDESLLRAKALMVEHEVRHLPVKDGNALVGLVTDRDIKRALDPDLGLPPKRNSSSAMCSFLTPTSSTYTNRSTECSSTCSATTSAARW